MPAFSLQAFEASISSLSEGSNLSLISINAAIYVRQEMYHLSFVTIYIIVWVISYLPNSLPCCNDLVDIHIALSSRCRSAIPKAENAHQVFHQVFLYKRQFIISAFSFEKSLPSSLLLWHRPAFRYAEIYNLKGIFSVLLQKFDRLLAVCAPEIFVPHLYISQSHARYDIP